MNQSANPLPIAGLQSSNIVPPSPGASSQSPFSMGVVWDGTTSSVQVSSSMSISELKDAVSTITGISSDHLDMHLCSLHPMAIEVHDNQGHRILSRKTELSVPTAQKMVEYTKEQLTKIQKSSNELINTSGDFDEDHMKTVEEISSSIKNVSRDYKTLKLILPEHQSFTEVEQHLQQLVELGEYFSSLRAEHLASSLGKREEEFMLQVQDQFQLVDIEPDGNCLFSAVCKGSLARKLKDPPTSLSLDETLSVINKKGSSETRTNPSELRTRVLNYVAEHTSLYRERVIEALEYALNPNHTDPTSEILRKELQSKFHEEAPDKIRTAEAYEIYVETMRKDRIYGERLEIIAAAASLEVPIYLYYFGGSIRTETGFLPAEK
eukprot:TRINITY_DN7492_c0_g1_i10.p1 TRINITY_DN7492_c0_g1~~TRINITY_DN7492_c0_g1_i10.p1  ORF type:complete len:379 (+),score=76.38 TRINITY_DN7492_c0_g1_i10:117-1253(+)